MKFQPAKTSRHVVVGVEAPEQGTGLFYILTRKPRLTECNHETIALEGCKRHRPETRRHFFWPDATVPLFWPDATVPPALGAQRT
jgi:hypothetical protein